MLTLALPLVVLPLLAWLLWDISRQQKRRAVARATTAAATADLHQALITFRFEVFDAMTPALQRAARAVADFAATIDPPSQPRTRERDCGKADRLLYISDLLGRQVTSSAEMTDAEAQRTIDALRQDMEAKA